MRSARAFPARRSRRIGDARAQLGLANSRFLRSVVGSRRVASDPVRVEPVAVGCGVTAKFAGAAQW